MPNLQRITPESLPIDWDVLALRSQQGSQSDYHQLLSLIAPVLSAYFRRNYATRMQADDLMQETLLAIHTKLHTYNSSQPFAPWLFAIARYKAIDHIRHSKRQVPTTQMPEDESLLGAAIVSGNELTAHETNTELQRALQLLSPRDRQLIELSKLQELSLQTIADQTRLSLSAVKIGIYRALKRLKAAMATKMEGN